MDVLELSDKLFTGEIEAPGSPMRRASKPGVAIDPPGPSAGRPRFSVSTRWIEDGPEARLEKLRAALDRMGLAPRGDES